jgi:hypothetical protein
LRVGYFVSTAALTATAGAAVDADVYYACHYVLTLAKKMEMCITKTGGALVGHFLWGTVHLPRLREGALGLNFFPPSSMSARCCHRCKVWFYL